MALTFTLKHNKVKIVGKTISGSSSSCSSRLCSSSAPKSRQYWSPLNPPKGTLISSAPLSYHLTFINLMRNRIFEEPFCCVPCPNLKCQLFEFQTVILGCIYIVYIVFSDALASLGFMLESESVSGSLMFLRFCQIFAIFSGYLQGMFRVYSEHVQGMIRVCSEYV